MSEVTGDAPPLFDAFVTEHGPGLVRYAYLLTGDLSVAEDVTQESLLRLYRAWPRVRREGAISFARTIVYRQVISHARRPSRRETALGDVPERPQIQRQAEDAADLVRAVRALPTQQRAVVVLRYYADLTEPAIAAELGIRTGTVKSHLARALRTLRSAPSLQR